MKTPELEIVRARRHSTLRRKNMMAKALWLVRFVLIVLIIFDVALVFLRVATYPSFLNWYGAASFEAEPLIALTFYALVLGMLPVVAPRVRSVQQALAIGAALGLIGGGLDIANLIVEDLLFLPQATVTIATLAGMLALFLTFTLAGFVATWRSGAFWHGVLSAIWSAVVAIVIAVTFGFLLLNIALPTLARDEVGDPDYARSGWRDPQAFAIANTFDAGLSHLVEGPVIAAILGSLGAGAGVVVAKRRKRVSAA
jgi:hypothetical protein